MSIVRLQLGETGDSEKSPLVGDRIFQSVRYFADFEAYLVSILGFALLAEASNNGQAAPYRPGDTVMLGCRQDGARWFWRPEPSVSLMTKNITPSEMYLERFPYPQVPIGAMLNLGALSALMYNFGQSLATNYFERVRPAVEKVHGSEPKNWPMVWNFARIIRNAMSHGGVINFKTAKSPAVSWRGLTYTPSDNGRQILHTDLWPGDIFDLIVEMDAAVR